MALRPADHDLEWIYEAREQCHDLAVQMVRLEALAASFDADGEYTRADLVRWDRDGVRRERSRLMREIWQRRRIVAPVR